MNCGICKTPIVPEDIDWPPLNRGDDFHNACLALGTVGHTFGVCHCTGFNTQSRESALELWRRIPHGMTP